MINYLHRYLNYRKCISHFPTEQHFLISFHYRIIRPLSLMRSGWYWLGCWSSVNTGVHWSSSEYTWTWSRSLLNSQQNTICPRLQQRMANISKIMVHICMQKLNSLRFLHKHFDWWFGIIIIKLDSNADKFILIWMSTASDGEAFHLPMIDIIGINIILQLNQSQFLIIGALADKGFDIVIDVLYGLSCHLWVRV